jgi:hypothetical protein
MWKNIRRTINRLKASGLLQYDGKSVILAKGNCSKGALSDLADVLRAHNSKPCEIYLGANGEIILGDEAPKCAEQQIRNVLLGAG